MNEERQRIRKWIAEIEQRIQAAEVGSAERQWAGDDLARAYGELEECDRRRQANDT
ncbi:hypothetical protein Deipr_2295 (plasmid) [Deinococcus proteolyticus MRP]|uniref:Uncharacterized protein n=1 Tax=Deinococcus proteolyticus (strain ATCC 35074 / DSM 20540 / JCM 6276 / NBRC 101906 / NCIMB 13154 / VKM Ac-1939 / CCM 2703 / MRP) TaxID=693977 RepID=F0RQ61_DEIPM|nr:hypothetical protein [Deinococcus proteolyticus]ADY27420.1 hypothetical protein Deipr_2295 [Deinococcus proteolyticus MRP]